MSWHSGWIHLNQICLITETMEEMGVVRQQQFQACTALFTLTTNKDAGLTAAKTTSRKPLFISIGK